MLSPVIEAVGDPASGNLQPAKVADLLRMPLETLAGLAHVHRNTLTRAPSSPQVQAGIGDVVRILVAATALMDGSAGRAVLWFRHQPIPSFGGKTAQDLVIDGRAAAVLTHLEMLSDGIYA